MPFVLRLSLVLIFFPSVLVSQVLQPLGAEFQVNTSTVDDQFSPDVAPLADGGFVVAWSSLGWDHYLSFPKVQIQRYDADGSKVGEEIQASQFTQNFQRRPKISAVGDGFVVVWESDGESGSEDFRSIQAHRYDSLGAPLGNEFRVNSWTTGDQTSPDVSPDGAGGFVVVWEEDCCVYGPPRRDIKAQRFDSDGNPINEEFRVNSLTTGRQNGPTVGPDGQGGFVVVWQSRENIGTYRIQGQRFGSNGVALNSEFRVSTGNRMYQYYPSVGPDAGADGFVVVWSSASTDYYNPTSYILGRRYDSTGTPIGGELNIHQSDQVGLFAPEIDPSDDGQFLVVWNRFDPAASTESRLNIQARLFGEYGFPVTDPFQLSSSPSEIRSFPVITSDGNGTMAIIWESNGSDGEDQSGSSIRGQRFSLSTSGGTEACIGGQNALCLQGGRFEVTVDWRNFQGEDGQAQVVPGASDDSGLLWFFNPDNWEMLVKVLDGCPLNNRYWVFAAATTNVEYNLVVRDTFTGETVSYHNNLGVASPAITDSGAFDTCP